MSIFIGINIFIIITLILISLVRWNAHKPIKRQVIIGAVGIIIIDVLLYNTFFSYNDEQVKVAMSSNEVHEDFVLNIENKKISYEQSSAKFASPIDMKQLQNIIRKQYPNAKIRVSNHCIYITKDNSVVSIKQEQSKNFIFAKRYDYEMESQFINLKDKDGEYICIPFPKEYLDIEGQYENIMKISCKNEEITEFYRDFSNVTIKNNEIFIDQEVPINIEVADGTISIMLTSNHESIALPKQKRQTT